MEACKPYQIRLPKNLPIFSKNTKKQAKHEILPMQVIENQ